jgi:hypothetical protein
MKLKDFIEKGQVRAGEKDKILAKSLLKGTRTDIKFLERLQINEDSSRKIMSNYYDALRSILEAVSAIDGFKIYSHEAFTYFLMEKNEELLATKFDRFRKIRNRINYYGKDISVEETKENIETIKRMINQLIKKYLDNM